MVGPEFRTGPKLCNFDRSLYLAYRSCYYFDRSLNWLVRSVQLLSPKDWEAWSYFSHAPPQADFLVCL